MGLFGFGKKKEKAPEVPEMTAAPVQETKSDDWIRSFDSFAVLDEETGLTYCGGEKEFYLEMLQEYCKPDTLELISKAFAEENWETYQINVHALKGTSLTVGAIRMHEVAKAIDTANKAQDREFPKAHHQAMMEEADRTFAYIRNYMNQ